MNVTAFGGIFVAATAFVCLFRRTWLLPLVCVSAVLQSPSVLDVEWRGAHYGVTPFMLVASVAALDLLRRWLTQPRAPLRGPARPVIALWSAFGAVSILSAFVLPWVFAGSPVISPLDKGGVDSDPVALVWSVSNLAQAINLILLMALMFWLVLQRHEEDLPRRMFVGMVLAVVVSTLIGLQQRLAWNGLLPLWDGFWTSNATYAQNYRTWSGPVARVNWPLVEPSYASAWFAAVLGGFIAMFLANVHRHKALAGAMVALFALGNTWGATGLLAAALFLLLALAVCVWAIARHPPTRGGLGYRLALGALVSACIALGTFLILRHYQMGGMVVTAFQNVLHGRGDAVMGDLRPLADLHGLRLIVETFGLGVGMGSHRGSSYLVTLASNTGLLGLLLFASAALSQWRAMVRLLAFEPAASVVFFLGASIAGVIAVSISIPDQNWPVLWILLFGGLTCLLVERDPRDPAAQAPQPWRQPEPNQGAV